MACAMLFIMSEPGLAYARYERYEMMWNDATDAERYFMPTEVKAYACGLSTADFIFFARVVEGEGADDDYNITDKVLVAATVLNRTNCGRWPTRTVIATLQRPGQFEVVDQETHEVHAGRSLDSEWSIVIAYRIIFVLAAALSVFVKFTTLYVIADILNGLMTIPNIISLLLLSGVIVRETRKYLWNKQLDKQSDEDVPIITGRRAARADLTEDR